MKITTTSVTQTGNEILGTEERNLYYLIVENDKGSKLVINVGKKTHDQVQKLKNEEEGKETNENQLKLEIDTKVAKKK